MQSSSPYTQDSPEWFTGTPQPQPQPPRRRLLLYGGIGIIIALIITGSITAINIFTRTGCLSAADYQDLTGVPYTDSLQPTASFYTAPISFSDNTALTTESKAEVQSLGDFYQKHQAKSLRFTINSSYSPADHKATATERTLALQQALANAGIPADHTVTNQPELISPEEDDVAPTQSLTITITSVEGCR